MFVSNIRRLFTTLFIAIIVGGIPAIGWPHDLWINLTSHWVSQGEGMKILLGWGHHYPFSDFIDPARIKTLVVVTPNGGHDDLTKDLTQLGTAYTPQHTGTYLVGVVMKPGYYTKTITGHTYKSKKESKDVVSSVWYEKYAKALFVAGTPGGEAFRKPLGHRLEIILLDDPGTMSKGDMLRVRVLFKGRPLAKEFVYGSYLGFPVTNAFAYAIRTNSKGVANIRLLESGVWRLMVQYVEPPEDTTLCDNLKYTAFFTFYVK